jgi:hypothetical protein
MKILTENFYKSLFGFIAIVFVSLVIIMVSGMLGKEKADPNQNIAGDCVENSTEEC